MEKKFNFVYITTNLINGKQYIGDHSTNNENLDPTYLGSGRPYLQRAIKEYGKENFKREILETFNTKECAFIAQEKYIIEYDTLVPNGYNISPKGGHKYKGSVSKETKEKIRNKQKGKSKLYYYIKKLGEELGTLKYNEFIEKQKLNNIGKTTKRKNKGFKQEFIEKYGEEEGIKRYIIFKEKQSDSHKGKYIGRKLSEDTKRKIGKSNLGKLNGHVQSKETIEKRAEKHRGTHHTKETKQKMSLAAKGKSKNYDVWNKNKTKLNITPEIIKEIVTIYKTGKTQQELAVMYNFSSSCISRIIQGFYDNKQQISRGK